MTDLADLALVQTLTAQPEHAALAERAGRVLTRLAAGERPFDASLVEGLAPELLRLPQTDVGELLTNGPGGAEAQRVLGALLALAAKPQLPSAPEQEQEFVRRWLKACVELGVDPFPFVDAALGAQARSVWAALAAVVLDSTTSRAERLLGAATLAAAPTGHVQRAELAGQLTEPLLQRLLTPGPALSLEGPLGVNPRSSLATALLGITGLLTLGWALAGLSRLALAYKRNGRIRLSARGLELKTRTELLGRVLSEKETVLPLTAIGRVSRELRFGSAGLYAGLAALVVGTWIGVGLFVDGTRVPGFSGALLGLAMVALLGGLALDFALARWSDRAVGRCRLVVVPRRGRALTLVDVDRTAADELLAALGQR